MNENRCVICGDIIPEGRQLCPSCWGKQFDLTAQKKNNLCLYALRIVAKRPMKCSRTHATQNGIAVWLTRSATYHSHPTCILPDSLRITAKRNGKTEWLWVKSLCCSVRNCGYLAIK